MSSLKSCIGSARNTALSGLANVVATVEAWCYIDCAVRQSDQTETAVSAQNAVEEIARLNASQAETAAKIEALKNRARIELRDSLEAQAKAAGFTMQELLGIKSPKRGGQRTAKATYRGPNGEEWGGLGKRPGWLRDAIAGGASLESFRIN